MALKVKKCKVKIGSNSCSENKKDDVEANLLVQCFKTFFKSKEGGKFWWSKQRKSNNKISRKRNVENFDSNIGLVGHRCRKPGHLLSVPLTGRVREARGRALRSLHGHVK